METLWNDIRFGLKSWLRSPATTAVALLTLALGIGANAAIFSVINGVLLRPLSFPHPERLALIWESNPGNNLPRFGVSPLNFEDWKRESQSFEAMAALSERRFSVTGGDRPEVISGARVSGDFFRVVGIEPALGRSFRAEEDRPGASRVAVISQGLWQRRFGSDPAVLGRAILLDGNAHSIIGVMPPGFDFYRRQDLWVPLMLRAEPASRGMHFLAVLGRMKPGVSMQRARSELKAIAQRLAQQYPDTNRGWTVEPTSYSDSVVEDVRPRLVLLLFAVAFVLLIACANVANLLLSRVAARQREIAVRVALGAGRGRVVRQMLTESVVLFTAGGACGLLLAFWIVRAVIAFNPEGIPRAGEIGLDWRVLLFTLALSLVTGLVFGLVPAFGATGGRLHEVLKEGGRSLGGGAKAASVRGGLVLAEVAVALVLLVGAMLLLRSFSHLQTVDPGFRSHGVLVAQISLPALKYPDQARQLVFYRGLQERLESLPGVESAGLVFPIPLGTRTFMTPFYIQGRPFPLPNEAPVANFWLVSPGAFETLHIPLLQGRRFTREDTTRSQPVVIINRTMAEEVWPGASPLGAQITVDDPRQPLVIWQTVVGVADDVRSVALSQESGYQLYQPLEQLAVDEAAILVRSAQGKTPRALGPSVRSLVAQLEPDLPLDQLQPMDDVVRSALAQSRFQALLLGTFAGVALVLAAIGVYGVVSYSVTQRTHEIGIRMALGAQRGEVLRLIVRRGMVSVVAGTALGLALSIVSSWYLADRFASFLFRVTATDPLTLLMTPVLLLLVALLANLIPARRATKVDPLVALRSD